MTDSEAEVLKRMLQRERAARTAAEKFLEQKSLELYEANQSTQEALAMSRRQAYYLETILNSTTDAILTINPDGKIQTANSSASQLFQLSDQEIIGLEAVRLVKSVQGDQPPSVGNHFFADLCTPKEPTVYAVGRRADGETIELELSSSHGKVDDDIIVTWVMRDIGYLRAMQRQNAISARLAGIGELAAGIAHEINTPVQFVHENTKFLTEAFEGIESALSVYEQHGIDDETLTKALAEACPADKLAFFRSEAPAAFEETKVGAQRIAKIVSAVKEFSHPGTDQKSPVDLNHSVHSASTVSRSHWKDVASIQHELSEKLDPIPGFASQINQVLVNLIVNAADAIAESDNLPGTIKIKTGNDGQRAFVSVADTGAGIAKEDVDRIFMPFFTTKPVGKGTGQGLAITHAIVVENHGGTIDIQSEVGKGTEFTIWLPT